MDNSSKTSFDSWVDTQSKTMENFMETSKKFQQSIMDGKIMEESADMYRKWFESQKEIMEKTFSTDFSKMMPNMASFQQMMPNMASFQQMMPNMNMMGGQNNPMQAMQEYMNQFMKAQEQMLGPDFTKRMREMMENPSAMMGNMASMNPENMLAEIRKMYDNWSSMYHDWYNHTSRNFEGIKNFLNGASGPNTMMDMMNTSQIYMKMYEVWQPMMETFRKNAEKMAKDANMDPEMFARAFNAEAYKEAIDRVFKFAQPEKFKEFYEQMNNFTKDYYDQARGTQEKLNAQFNEFSKEIAAKVNPNYSAMMSNMNEQMEKMMGPFTKLMPNGREKEAMEAMQTVQEKLSTYWAKYSELQYLIYVASQKAFDHVAQDTMERMRSNESVGNYNEFFNNWLNTTEKSVTEAFQTEEFSKAQGELLNTGLEIKKTLEKQMENMLAAYPVVSRTEADEMAQVIHDLKSRVRSLEKQVSSGGSSEEETKKAPAKKSTASTAAKA